MQNNLKSLKLLIISYFINFKFLLFLKLKFILNFEKWSH